MVKNRYFTLIAFLVIMLGLVGVLFACSNDSAPEEATEVNPETTDTVVKVELSFIVDEEFDEAMTEIQALYSSEHKDIGFTENRYAIPEEVIEKKSEKVLGGITPNDPANADDATKKEAEAKEGSVADLFLTSSREAMDEIEEIGFTDPTSRFDMFTTELVIVARNDSSVKKAEWDDIASGNYQVALGNETMMEGNAARQALAAIGAYLDPAAEVDPTAPETGTGYQNFTPLIGSSLEELMTFLEKGSADVAIMYATDASQAEGLKVVGEVPVGTYTAPLYPAAASIDSEYPEEVESFLAWATSDEEAQKVWQKHGLSFPS